LSKGSTTTAAVTSPPGGVTFSHTQGSARPSHPPTLPTVTLASARAVGSAWLVATTWNTPSLSGARYTPLASIEPPPDSRTDHVTPLSSVPSTCAVKVWLAR